jgi:hypothetical protein
MAAMSSRVLTALGVAAALVAVAALAALAFAFAGSDQDDAAAAAQESGAADLPARPSSAPASRPRSQSPGSPSVAATPEADTSSQTAPVPALAAKPARGPAFAIARLRPGVRTALWGKPGEDRVATLGPRTEFGSPVVLAVVRRRGGWLGVASPDLPNGRLGWIRDDPLQVAVYWTKYSLHADLSQLSLTLRYGSRTVGRFLVTVGAPGSETPSGRYGITDALRFEESPSYGCCALALSGRQTALPEDWIGGDRLAIHGTPGPVGGAESHGCIRATDTTMRELFRRVPLGTPLFVEG